MDGGHTSRSYAGIWSKRQLGTSSRWRRGVGRVGQSSAIEIRLIVVEELDEIFLDPNPVKASLRPRGHNLTENADETTDV